MKARGLVVALALGASIAACGSEEEKYAGSALSGKIGGQSWTFVSGSITENRAVLMYDVAVDFANPPANLPPEKILFTVPELAEKEWELKLSITDLAHSVTVTLYDGTTNNIASDGRYEITGITATEVTGRMMVEANANNEVNGTFTLTRIQ